jgi:hypothetical protein
MIHGNKGGYWCSITMIMYSDIKIIYIRKELRFVMPPETISIDHRSPSSDDHFGNKFFNR